MTPQATALFFSAVLLALGSVNLWWWYNPIETTPVQVSVDDQRSEFTENFGGSPREETSADNIEDAVLRPLFHASRRPVLDEPALAEQATVPAQSAEAPARVLLPAVTLAGTSLTSGKWRALIMTPASQEPQWVAEGGKIDGWTVSGIDAKTLYLSNGGSPQAIRLFPTAASGQ